MYGDTLKTHEKIQQRHIHLSQRSRAVLCHPLVLTGTEAKTGTEVETGTETDTEKANSAAHCKVLFRRKYGLSRHLGKQRKFKTEVAIYFKLTLTSKSSSGAAGCVGGERAMKGSDVVSLTAGVVTDVLGWAVIKSDGVMRDSWGVIASWCSSSSAGQQ